MDDSFLLIFDYISLACGVYCLYVYMKLRLTKHLFKNSILLPSGKEPKDCLDEEAFVAYMRPKLLVLGIVTFLFGVLCLVDEKFNIYNLLVNEILTGISFLTVVWFGVCSSKANKRYW